MKIIDENSLHLIFYIHSDIKTKLNDISFILLEIENIYRTKCTYQQAFLKSCCRQREKSSNKNED